VVDGSVDRNGLDALSPGEVEALGMAARGMTNAQIATRAGVSVHAIKFRLASAYRKLHVTNRTEAAVTFLQYERSLASNRGEY
jgi:DNA-binding CsgD family transcriptional regulator